MATIADVAREAGVSISTVSYALSGKRSIKSETRERVLAAAARLRYAPDAYARTLASRRSHIVAVTAPLHPDTDHYAHMAFAMEVTMAARASGYDTLLLVDDDAYAGMDRAEETSLSDGMIVLDVSAHDERVELARKGSTPTVFIGLPEDTEGLTCVDLDFEAGMRLAIDELVAQGHSRMALVTQPPSVLKRESNYPLRVRAEFERHCAARGVDAIVVAPEPDGASAALDEIAAQQPGTTALLLNTVSAVAQSIGPELASRGISIPADVSVVAVGMTPMADRAPLPFDGIPLDPRLTCPVAVDLLVARMAGAEIPEVTLVAPVFESRGTVGPARDVAADAARTLAAASPREVAE